MNRIELVGCGFSLATKHCPTSSIVYIAGRGRRWTIVHAQASCCPWEPERSTLPPSTGSACPPDPPFPKANIYIRNFHACIADFGTSTIARMEPWVDNSTISTTPLVSFTSGGSLRWMSPELLDPKRFNLPDPRPTKESDRFALGMVIYEVRCCQLLVLLKLCNCLTV